MPAGFGLIINERREILLIQRGYGREKGKWSLPGGNQDRGESLRRTAIRETKEETGIRMGSVRLYYKGNRHRIEVWRGKHIGGKLRIQRRECLDAKWFQYDMLPHDRNLAFGPDKIAIGKWANENERSRRVYYPRAKMQRAGFALVVNYRREILLLRQSRGPRKGKWTLPGGNPSKGMSRRDAAIRAASRDAGVKFTPRDLYFENRHRAKVWIGRPASKVSSPDAKWFPLDRLPDDDSLAFAIDVRTVEKWASENPGTRRVHLA